MKLSELRGTEKQIAWAFKIRQDFINKYQMYSDDKIEYFSQTSAEVVHKIVESVLEKEESSKFYIEKIRIAYDVWQAILMMSEKFISYHLIDKNIKYSNDKLTGIVGIKDMGDKIQFVSLRYPSFIGTMDWEKSKEIGYNEWGQFIWEKEKPDEEYTLEVVEEWLQLLGYTVYFV